MKYDIEYIKNYIFEYDSGVPMSISIFILLSVCGIIIALFRYSIDGSNFLRNAFRCILGGYLFFVFCATILFRDIIVESPPVLCPLWSYSVLYEKLIAEILLNLLMFIPVGFAVSASLRRKNIVKIVGIGCGISLAIEILQFVTQRGIFNIDDIIHNTLGCVIGYGVYRLCNTILINYIK